MTNKCILITASISPRNVPQVAQHDQDEREMLYSKALEIYKNLGIPIIFCENSGTYSQRIIELMRGVEKFEYLCYDSMDSYKGKGHGEKEILDFVYANSVLLKETVWVIKISGRYKIRNIASIIRDINNLNSDVVANLGRNLSWADTRIMIFKKSFYSDYFKPFLEKYLDEKNKIYFERVYARSIHGLLADGGVFQPWNIYPYYFGVNGANGRPIKFYFFRRLKFSLYFKIKTWIFKQIV